MYDKFDFEETPTRVARGCVVVNEAVIVDRSDTVALIAIDLSTKYAAVEGSITGGGDGPTIIIDKDDRTIQLSARHTGPTLVTLTEFAGWEDWSVSCSRYTVYVALRRDSAETA